MTRKSSHTALEAEAKARSEDVSEEVLNEAAVAIFHRPIIDRDHDIPYVAGYSLDGRTIYIDRHMPHAMRYHGRQVHTDKFIVMHELVEKALLDEMRLHYLHAHQIALRTEQAAVRAAGIRWRDYNRFTKQNGKKIGDERLVKVPRSLDLTPYRDEDDFPTLQKVINAQV